MEKMEKNNIRHYMLLKDLIDCKDCIMIVKEY